MEKIIYIISKVYLLISTLLLTIVRNIILFFLRCIFVSSYRFLLKLKLINKRTEDVLVITSGVLGDSIIITQTLLEIQKYCTNNNLGLTIVCTAIGSFIFRDIAGINATFLIYADRDSLNKEEVHKIRNTITSRKWKILLRFGLHQASLKFSIPAIAEKSAFYSNFINTLPYNDKRICKSIFNNLQNVKGDVFIPNMLREAIVSTGMDNFKTKPFLISMPKDAPSGLYILICPEASSFAHTLDILHVKEIVNFLSMNYSKYKILISTNNRNHLYTDILTATFKGSQVTLEISDRNTIQEYTRLINNAALLLSTDSGGAHLGIMLKTPTIVLGGYWEEPNFFPYNHDEKISEKQLQFISAREKPVCAYCRNRMKYYEQTECNERIKNHQCARCLAEINTEDVKNTIKTMLEE